MIHSGFYKQKIIIPLIGLVMGILLFLAAFAALLDGILFSSEFQEKALNNIGIYSHAAEIAGTLSSGIGAPETGAGSLTDIKPFFSSTASPDLISQNIKSVTDGLISYFKGYTEELPDLHLIADNESVKVNLSIIFIIFGEFNITDVLLVISLLQFVLKYVSIFGLLLFLALLYIMLNTDKKGFYGFLNITAAICLILCLAAGILILVGLNNAPPAVLAQMERFEAISPDVLKGYISYCANTLSARLILLGIAVFAAVRISLLLFERRGAGPGSLGISLSKETAPARNYSVPPRKPRLCKAAAMLLLPALLSSAVFYVQIRWAYQDFAGRDLSRAVSFIKGRVQYYRITDATNDPVYLLSIKVLDSTAKLPVPDLSAFVSVSGGKGSRLIHSYTDSDGAAVFLLDQGRFSLELYSGGILADYTPSGLPSFEFDMAMPGKSELVILLDSQAGGTPSVKEAVLQYIP